MEARSARRRFHEGKASELVWLLEHPPLYTRGASAKIWTCSIPRAFQCSTRRAAGSSPITVPASASPM